MLIVYLNMCTTYEVGPIASKERRQCTDNNNNNNNNNHHHHHHHHHHQFIGSKTRQNNTYNKANRAGQQGH